jgi:hypothetical protein
LLDPTVSSSLPQVSASVQNFGTHLLFHIWTVSGQIPAGSNQIGQLTFQVAAKPATADLTLAMGSAVATKANSVQFSSPTSSVGNVVVVGSQPLLKPSATLNSGKTLTVYGNLQSEYQVQASSDLKSWKTVLTYEQTNLTQEVTLPASGPIVFYRIVQL